MLDNFLASLAFFTTIPIPQRKDHISSLAGISAWITFVGLVIGLCVLFANKLFGLYFPTQVSSALTLVVWVGITGGLHLDGLADCTDAFFAAITAERRVQIMKDPHIGSFGVIGIVLLLLVKWAAIQAQVTDSIEIAPFIFSGQVGLLITPVMARWSVLWMDKRHSSNKEGLGYHFTSCITTKTMIAASVLPLLMIALGGMKTIFTVIIGLFSAWFISWFARKKIGSITGDVMGMTIEFVEGLCLICFI